mgnify:CR=1 FL=1
MPGRDQMITLQRFDETARNDLNEIVGRWVEVSRVWANRRDSADVERVVAAAEQSAVATRFVVRSNEVTRALTPKHRVWDGQRAWNIKGLANGASGRHRTVEIVAVADSSGGAL